MNSYFNNLKYIDGIYSSFEVSSVHYPQEGNNVFYNIEENSFWYRHRNNCILKIINKFQPQGKIFEIGGGNGFVSKAIQDSGFDITLIEPDLNGVLNARERGVKNLICSSFYNLNWTDKKLDNVALFDVLEHIEKDTEFLIQLGAHLKKEGLLYITVPSYKILFSTEDTHDGHFRRYTLTELKQKLTLSGFKIQYASYFFTYLFFPILFLKALPSKLHLGKYRSLEKYKISQNQHKYQIEHKVNNKFIQKILNFLHHCELLKINNLSKMTFGASCLIVAKK